jgi:AcrR family transcriptional regulator
LAGGDLAEHRHVCGLFRSRAEADQALGPFIFDGLERGERAVEIVDPRLWGEHLEDLVRAGVDVPAALSTGRLAILTWDEAYLKAGLFDPTAAVTFMRETLEAARVEGYGLTWIVANMDWALLDGIRTSDLIAYEGHLDELLRRYPDPVVCSYDLARHSAGTIVDVLALHAVAIVGGALRPSQAAIAGARTARERILKAAGMLFHDHGIVASGVDTIIATAGVAKATFYRHFPSKDDLVVAWLRDPRSRWLDTVRVEAAAQASSPEEVIPRFFASVAAWLESDGFHGCPYLNTAVEIGDDDHPAKRVILDFLQEVEDYFRNELDGLGYDATKEKAAQLQNLVAGALSLGVARQTSEAALASGRAATLLLEAWPRNLSRPS